MARRMAGFRSRVTGSMVTITHRWSRRSTRIRSPPIRSTRPTQASSAKPGPTASTSRLGRNRPAARPVPTSRPRPARVCVVSNDRGIVSKTPRSCLITRTPGPSSAASVGIGYVEFAAGGRAYQRRRGVGPGPFGIKGPVARHLGPFPYRQPGEAAAYLPAPDERPPAITCQAVPRDLGTVQLFGRHGFDWISPQRDDATDYGHDRLRQLEGALTDGRGVERGGFSPSQRLSTLLFYAGLPADRKSVSRALTWSGASSCIQWPGPSRRSYRQGPVTCSAESVICTSVRAGSPVLQTPMVGACTGGSWSGGPTHDSGGTLARYHLRPGVSEPVASRSATTWSASGCPPQARKLNQPSSVSQRSATPGNWNSSMYHDCSRCRGVRRKVAGWPTESATRWSTVSGRKVASAQASAAPQSWPTT